MNAEYLYYLWAALLLVANCAAWTTTLVALPGNWLVVLLSALFAIFVTGPEGAGLRWWVIGVAAALAAVGELIEFAAGAAGAAKMGGSRRGIVLALAGTVAGSLLGAIVFSAVLPIIGTVVGALGGGAGGAFAGAYFGELWKGRTQRESAEIGKGALIGRLLGTGGKLVLGAVALVIITIDSFV